MLTLVLGSDVGVVVIDAWSSLLNQRERVKDPGAPSRFFASTYTTVMHSVDFIFFFVWCLFVVSASLFLLLLFVCSLFYSAAYSCI